MLLRRATAAAAVLTLACTGLASAATRRPAPPACNLLRDPKADATEFYIAGEGTAPNDPAADIVSADVASNGKQLTTVLRVDKLAKSGTTAPTGYVWYAYFTVAGQEFYTQAKSDPTGDTFTVGYTDANGLRTALKDSTAKGVVDVAKNEVRATFNVSQLAELAAFKKGGKITGLRALTNRGFVRVVFQADEADGGKTYVDGTKSCVTVGK